MASEKRRVDTANVVWSEVTACVVSWDGSCEVGTFGAEKMIQAFSLKPLVVSGLGVASKDMKKSGWTLRTLSGLKLLYFVASWTGASKMVRAARA